MEELPDTALFIREMYKRAGFKSWADFAREAKVLASSISDWKDGRNQPEGPNLIKLIRAVERVKPEALGASARAIAPADSETVAQEVRALRDDVRHMLEHGSSHMADLTREERWLWTASLNPDQDGPDSWEVVAQHMGVTEAVAEAITESAIAKVKAARERRERVMAAVDSGALDLADRLAAVEAREVEVRDLLTRGFAALGVVLEPQDAQQPGEAPTEDHPTAEVRR